MIADSDFEGGERQIKRSVSIGMTAAFLFTGVTAQASAAEPTVSSEPSTVASDGSVAASSYGRSPINLFTTHGDNAHVTRGEVSVHGWWTKQSGPAKKAKVTVWLQAHKGSKWKSIDEGVRTVKPGTSKRANARKKCKNRTTKVKFRTKVDVDIIGYADSPRKLYTKGVKLRCKV
ncbi:hypothetical protein ACFW4X_20720 [Streptomyces smyrnaeus]|uniref:hypothetical protein n=1 Tax=Streptomyces smyrnaeus TaxID=1387713 RepID=UPI00367FC748